jgi:hypothetical protein
MLLDYTMLNLCNEYDYKPEEVILMDCYYSNVVLTISLRSLIKIAYVYLGLSSYIFFNYNNTIKLLQFAQD